MRISKQVVIGGIAAFGLVGVAGVALASHGKAGLWDVTITMGGNAAKMPDISKLPPEAQARMKAMGMSMNGNTMNVQHCMTAQEVAVDKPPTDTHNKDCTVTNSKITGHTMSADMTCHGDFSGTGHMQFTYDSDTHYSGEVSMTGTAAGHPTTQDNKFEGKWVSADCGAVSH